MLERLLVDVQLQFSSVYAGELAFIIGLES